MTRSLKVPTARDKVAKYTTKEDYDRFIHEVSDAALGREAIICGVAGVPDDYMDGRKKECLIDGEIKFRMSDRAKCLGGCDGHCKGTWSDPVSFVAAQKGIKQIEAARLLAVQLGIHWDGQQQKHSSPARLPPVQPVKPIEPKELDADGYTKHPQSLEVFPLRQKMVDRWCRLNGISFDTLQAFGAKLGNWKQFPGGKTQIVICIPIYTGPNLDLVNWTIYAIPTESSDGLQQAFLEIWDDGKTKNEKKYAAFSGSDRVGISLSLADRERLLTGERLPGERLTILKVEGHTDALAGYEQFSGTGSNNSTLVFTNSDGARSTLDKVNGPQWLLSMFDRLEPEYYAVLHDRDEAGVKGAIKWANLLARPRMRSDDSTVSPIVRIPVLEELEYKEKKGYDLRDWLAIDGNGFAKLDQLIANAPIHAYDKSIDRESKDQQIENDLADIPSDTDVTDATTQTEPVATESESSKANKSARPKIEVTNILSMMDDYPDLREEVIKGVLRRGEIMNIIAGPKLGKSYLALGLGWSIASGNHWLGFDVAQGRVLLIDNELHRQTLTNRTRNVAFEMQIPANEVGPYFDVVSLRGDLCDIDMLRELIDQIEPGKYRLVILDALYRMLPKGADENDNAAMAAIFNTLDQYAAKIDSAIAVIHHSSKGDQSSKGVTDVGSGAGSISRAVDTHLVLRRHRLPRCAVLEAVTRSFKAPEAMTIQFDYPVWIATTAEPELLQAKSSTADKQERENKEAEELVILALEKDGTPLSVSELRSKACMGDGRIRNAIGRLVRDGKLIGEESIGKTGKPAIRYSITKSETP